MGIRFKLLMPLTIGLIAFILFVHYYWVDIYLESEYRHYKEKHELLIKMLEPELTRTQISGDLAYMHTFLDWQMKLHKAHWQQIVVYNKKGHQLYPLRKAAPASGKYIFKLHDNLHFDGKSFGHIILTVDWANERQEELQRVQQIEQSLIVVFFMITLASAFWQNHLVRYPLLRLKKAATRLTEGDYEEMLPAAGNDEIGQLTRAFENMRIKLKKSCADFQKALTDARYSEAQQRAVISTMVDAFIIIDKKGDIKRFNPAAEQTFGYDASEVLNENIKMLIPEPCADTCDDPLSSYHDTGETHILGQASEMTGLKKDGSIITIGIRVSEIDAGGKQLFSCLVRDISERKRIEAELRIAAIALNTREGIIITDPGATILRVNQAFTRITGYEEDELIGQNPRLLQSGHHTPDFYTEMWDSLIRTDQWSSEIWDRRKNGEIFPQWASITAVKDDEDNVTHYVGSFLDISELKEKQLQLEHQAQELSTARDAAEAAARAKSEFLSIMSHEIRTPLNGILGMAQLLSNSNLNKNQHEYLQIITRSGNSLLTIINDILDFSKMDARKMALELLDFNLKQTAFEVIRLLRIKAEEKGLELIFHYAPSCPRYLIGDAGRIRQILINLVNNAIKFTKYGHVLLDISCLPGTGSDPLESNHAQLIFKIRDTGIGISSKNQAMLFNSFSQADPSTTRKFGGTGLGLAICKKLVTLMEGEISVESKPGKGATFIMRINLPISRQTNRGT